MASRIVSMAAFGLVAVVVAVLAIVFVSGRSAQQPDAPPPVAFVPTMAEPSAPPFGQAASDEARGDIAQQASEPVAATEAASGSGQKELASPDQPDAAPEATEASPVAKLPPWPVIEGRFTEARTKRAKLGDCWQLAEGYSSLALPQSTGSAGYPEHCTRLGEWRREVPESTTALICLAEAHIKWAWEARGSGWAGTVNQEGWEQFSTRIAEARRLLEEAIEKGVKDGQAYASLMTVAMAEGVDDDQARAWFDAGQKLDPHYLPLYRAMAVRLMPRWGGEPGDVERFAAEVIERVPGDDGLEIFGHIALEIHQYECNMPDTLFWGQYDHKLLMKAAELLAERYPDSEPAVHFAAVCAMATQDHDAARRIRPRLGPFSAEHRVWLWERSYTEFLRWCDAGAVKSDESHWVWGSHLRPCNIAFDADPRYIWCGQGVGPRAVALLDYKTRGVQAHLVGPLSQLIELTFHREKEWVLAGMGGGGFQGWVLWDTSTPVPLLHSTDNRCMGLAINPARQQVAWMEGTKLKLWDVENNQDGPTIDIPNACRKLVFSSDGNLIAADCRPNIVWDATTGEKRYELPHPQMTPRPDVYCQLPLAFDDDGSLWAVGHAPPQGPPQPGEPFRPRFPLVRFAPNGDAEIFVEDLVANGLAAAPEAVLSPDRRWLAVSPNVGPTHPIQLWDLQTRKLARQLSGSPSLTGAMAFSGDSKQLAAIGETGGVIKIWKLDDLPSSGGERAPADINLSSDDAVQ